MSRLASFIGGSGRVSTFCAFSARTAGGASLADFSPLLTSLKAESLTKSTAIVSSASSNFGARAKLTSSATSNAR